MLSYSLRDEWGLSMKIFVSSRMTELFIERKTAIEVLHFAGYTPLYIETEPIVKDVEARHVMLSLLRDADGFASIHYLSEGQRSEEILGNYTPIEFELVEFMKLHPKKTPILLRRRPDDEVVPSPSMIQFFKHKADALKTPIVEFRTPSELHERLLAAVSHSRVKPDVIALDSVLVIRYLGPDFIGLVGKVSETLFTKYRLNIDYISHASHDGVATLCLSCSPRDVEPRVSTEYGELVRADVEAAINVTLASEVAAKRVRVHLPKANNTFTLTVDVRKVQPKPPQFYVEIRTIDAPGQLNAICKVFRDRRFNIDHLQQRPTPAEYARQATSVWWLSKPSSRQRDQRADLASIEAALQYLVGVRSFSIKALT
jgi:predicted amino acid-binding ACT domain protein